jgi:TolB protein
MRSASHLFQAFPRHALRLAVLIFIFPLMCIFPNRLLRLITTSTETLLPAVSQTQPLTATRTPSPIPEITITPSVTPSPQGVYSSTITEAVTITEPPPTLTPEANQITSGYEIWQLEDVEFPPYITSLGRLYSPPTRRDPFPAYVFIRLNFECKTGESLIQLYSGEDIGLTFVHKQIGYPDLSIEDLQGHKYLVTLLGACWLAAPIPRTSIRDGVYILNFKDLPPFKFYVQPAAQEAQDRICYISDLDGTDGIFTMNPDGSDATRLTTFFDRAAEPDWSPDHQYIAYVNNNNENAEIKIIDSKGLYIRDLASSPFAEGGPTWSPDGEQIAFHSNRSGNWDIYTVSSLGGDPIEVVQDLGDEMYPNWSPDGKKVAFQSNRSGNWEIYWTFVDGRDAFRVTIDPADDILPSWSPDGSRFLFWSKRSGSWRLFSINTEGAELSPITSYENPGTFPSRAVWSHDGQSFLVTLLRKNFLQIYKYNLEGAEPVLISNKSANNYMPDW